MTIQAKARNLFEDMKECRPLLEAVVGSQVLRKNIQICIMAAKKLLVKDRTCLIQFVMYIKPLYYAKLCLDITFRKIGSPLHGENAFGTYKLKPVLVHHSEKAILP
jgi:hypothetical protein